MYLNKKIIAIIPARKNSKGIKNKNLQKLGRNNLVQISVNSAIKSKYIDQIIVSSDSNKILESVNGYKNVLSHIRKKSLSHDKSLIIDVILDILKIHEYDYMILLQPTSPFRTTKDIDGILKETITNKRKSAISLKESNSIPEFMYFIDKSKKLSPYLKNNQKSTNRQSYKNYYVPNGELYVSDTDFLKKSKKIIHKKTFGYFSNNHISIDIDSMADLELAKALFKINNNI
tara:strand:+ start:13136 stop:13828 length:693 start_codon:yes stop_codon:yes gene_type:complete